MTGQTYVQDPVTGEYLLDDDVTGTRNGSDATWTTSTNLVVKGKFDTAGGFAGTQTNVLDGGTGTGNYEIDQPGITQTFDWTFQVSGL